MIHWEICIRIFWRSWNAIDVWRVKFAYRSFSIDIDSMTFLSFWIQSVYVGFNKESGISSHDSFCSMRTIFTWTHWFYQIISYPSLRDELISCQRARPSLYLRKGWSSFLSLRIKRDSKFHSWSASTWYWNWFVWARLSYRNSLCLSCKNDVFSSSQCEIRRESIKSQFLTLWWELLSGAMSRRVQNRGRQHRILRS